MKLKRNTTDRKLRGAYFTPYSLARAMVKMGPTAAHKILEPSCGEGVFLKALNAAGYADDLTQIDAVEIDHHSIELAERSCGLSKTCAFHNQDFFEFYSRVSSEADICEYDYVIGNPPYIRYQYMTSQEREELSDLLRKHGMKANKLINAWVGFIVACTDLLRTGGTISFVVPAELLQVAYAEDLRHFLAERYTDITILTFNKLIFEDIEQEVVVFSAVKSCNPCRIRVVSFADADAMDISQIENSDFQPLLPSEQKWTKHFISSKDAAALDDIEKDSRLVHFAELALINVGVTTGDNKYFSLTDKTANRYDLASYTIPLIGRSSHASGVYFTEDDWNDNLASGKAARLLVLEPNAYDRLTDSQQAYINEGVEAGIDKGYKCSIRDSWYSIPSIWTPDAFFLRRNNLFPKMVLNACDAISTDTMHRIKIHDGVDRQLLVLCYYNSLAFAFTELCGRSYGGGVLEILPGEAGNILMPNPVELKLEDFKVRQAIDLIDETLRERKNIEPALDHVDALVLRGCMGFTVEQCAALRRIWLTLQHRRLTRSH